MLTDREKAILSACPRGRSSKGGKWRLVRIRMRQEEAAVLLNLASYFGCTTFTGKTPGVPQISTLMRAISRGILGVHSSRTNEVAVGNCSIKEEPARSFLQCVADFEKRSPGRA